MPVEGRGWTDGMWGGGGDRTVLSGGRDMTRIAEVDGMSVAFRFVFSFSTLSVVGMLLL